MIRYINIYPRVFFFSSFAISDVSALILCVHMFRDTSTYLCWHDIHVRENRNS
jgi:hypothetical protein